jgi:two-component system, OmpR family, osmolarity sensor histidine kinase EnvZ
MIRDWFHDRLPRTFYGRAVLIVLLPVVTLQVIITLGFVQRHYANVSEQMTRVMGLELAYLAEVVNGAPSVTQARLWAQGVGRPLELEVDLPQPAPAADAIRPWDVPGRTMAATFRDGGAPLLAADLQTPRQVRLWLDTRWGPVEVEFSRRRIAAHNPHQLLVLMAVSAILTTIISVLFLRNQVRPIRRLAEAATAYGRGRLVPYRASGASEIRAAGTAFLDMRARIERQTQARTTMLAGVSHDLRQPLTRLRLGLAMLEGPDAEHLTRDVEDMQRMLDAFLDFARGDAEDEEEPTEVSALARMVVEGFARTGQSVRLAEVEGAEAGPRAVRPLAVRRALENLIANALAYGTRADVRLCFGDRTVRLSVEDDGPGIPPDRREEALRPFARLDQARNQDRPGVGLGLAIVADIARSHGGSLRLGESATLGGLRADLLLAR